MDGVLVDTEPLYKKMNLAFFAELGVAIDDEEYNSFIGIAANKMWAYVCQKGQLTQSIASLKAEEKQRKYQLLEQDELKPVNGIVDLLKALKQVGLKVAVASSSPRPNINLILDKTQLRPWFDFVISGEQVAKGKPEPDIFLAVAQHFQEPPAWCWVVEDSRNGSLAAKAAKMQCIGFQTPNSGQQDLSKADFTIEDFGVETREKILHWITQAQLQNK